MLLLLKSNCTLSKYFTTKEWKRVYLRERLRQYKTHSPKILFKKSYLSLKATCSTCKKGKKKNLIKTCIWAVSTAHNVHPFLSTHSVVDLTDSSTSLSCIRLTSPAGQNKRVHSTLGGMTHGKCNEIQLMCTATVGSIYIRKHKQAHALVCLQGTIQCCQQHHSCWCCCCILYTYICLYIDMVESDEILSVKFLYTKCACKRDVHT